MLSMCLYTELSVRLCARARRLAVCQAFSSWAGKHEHKETTFSRQSSILLTPANIMGFCKMSALHVQLEGAECFKTITRANLLVCFTGLSNPMPSLPIEDQCIYVASDKSHSIISMLQLLNHLFALFLQLFSNAIAYAWFCLFLIWLMSAFRKMHCAQFCKELIWCL